MCGVGGVGARRLRMGGRSGRSSRRSRGSRMGRRSLEESGGQVHPRVKSEDLKKICAKSLENSLGEYFLGHFSGEHTIGTYLFSGS